MKVFRKKKRIEEEKYQTSDAPNRRHAGECDNSVNAIIPVSAIRMTSVLFLSTQKNTHTLTHIQIHSHTVNQNKKSVKKYLKKKVDCESIFRQENKNHVRFVVSLSLFNKKKNFFVCAFVYS